MAPMRVGRGDGLSPVVTRRAHVPVADRGDEMVTVPADRMARFAAGGRRIFVRPVVRYHHLRAVRAWRPAVRSVAAWPSAVGSVAAWRFTVGGAVVRRWVRAATFCVLVAAGWLVAVLFGLLLGAAPAAAGTSVIGAPAQAAASVAGQAGEARMAATGADGAVRGFRAMALAHDRARVYDPLRVEGTVRGHDEAQRAGWAAHEGGDVRLAVDMPAFPAIDGAAAAGNAAAMAGRGVDGLTSQSTPVLPAPSTADHGAGPDGFVPHGGGGSGQFGPGAGDVARSAFDPRVTVRRAPVAAVQPPVVRTAADEPSFSPD